MFRGIPSHTGPYQPKQSRQDEKLIIRPKKKEENVFLRIEDEHFEPSGLNI